MNEGDRDDDEGRWSRWNGDAEGWRADERKRLVEAER